jgi:uncharacterized protein YjbI with pentapeptide repeats
MSKRWADLPWGIRWTIGGIAVVGLALAIVWALFVPLADWLAHHDVGSVTGSLHETALDNARGRLLTLGAGLFAAGALVFTVRNFTLSREGQVTDRYTKAIEQLGSDKFHVRIGGIYALERVVRDSARDHPAVIEVLTAFIREHSREQGPPSGPDGQEQARSARPDIQAALTVVGSRDQKRDIRLIDLSGSDLTGAVLTRANLTRADLTGADLTGANLSSADYFYLGAADLTGADLTRANLTGARASGAVLRGAVLRGAILSSADLGAADLRGAILSSADLGGADLRGAYLIAATLTGANLSSADLTAADLTNADLTGADLTGADLTRAEWTRGAPPAGWKLGAGSRLERAGTDSGPTEAS